MKKEELTRYHTYDDWYTGDKILEFPPQTTEEHNYSLDTHVVESDAEWYNIEEVDKLLDFKEKQLSETEEKLKRAYDVILENHKEAPDDKGFTGCGFCNGSDFSTCGDYIVHDQDCIVLEAQTWLEDKE